MKMDLALSRSGMFIYVAGGDAGWGVPFRKV